ncbi:LysR family transcriptional regulator [Ramlibacter sp. AW1]|uniref:LysR family transcriptional regulator n=1 Tax=Ramlibacter aurantiacus TaxID=2801330 RepID=A0A936ZKV7_9BURK|nr:LysR substrate-binding domain-containing protein [Ramlibacter aurantiacus]MBL0419095.1 LysR family transcriptional regulator [Ramlibacter aurantiacus]
MDLRQLRYLIAIVEAGSVTDASRRLHVAQPALSQRIASLEEELGLQLLVRTRQGVSPTAAGQELYARAKIIVKQVAAAAAATREKAGHVGGRVGIGLLRSMAPYLATALFRRLRAEAPGIVPEIVVGYSDELVQAIDDARLDIALRVLPVGAKPALPVLLDEPLCVVGPPALLAGMPPQLELSDLAALPLLVSPTQPIHQVLQRTARERGLSFQVVGSVESSTAAAQLCAEGYGAFVTPKAAAQFVVNASGGRLDQRIVTGFDRQVGLYANPEVARSASVETCERILLEVLRERARELL